MADDLLAAYLEHLEARLRLRRSKPTAEAKRLAVLPGQISRLSSQSPRECLDLIRRALASTDDPEIIEAIGDQLLENLLNERSGSVAQDIAASLRDDKKFRQALACANHASVDPALISDWVNIFQSLNTTKEAERKGLRKMRRRSASRG